MAEAVPRSGFPMMNMEMPATNTTEARISRRWDRELRTKAPGCIIINTLRRAPLEPLGQLHSRFTPSGRRWRGGGRRRPPGVPYAEADLRAVRAATGAAWGTG